MASAIFVSFFVGYSLFPERWSWIVLTAFVVSSGNRGRLDVLYKSVLRVAGSAAGTIIALFLPTLLGTSHFHQQFVLGILILFVFLGVWLRPLGYGWWALCITVALGLLQSMGASSTHTLLWQRLEEIVIGALIAIASAWFILPIHSSAVLRKRMGEALALLSEVLNQESTPRHVEALINAITTVEELYPTFHACRLLTRHFISNHPADWIDLIIACKERALTLVGQHTISPSIKRAVGNARKALREPDTISPALQDLLTTLINQK